AGSIEGTLRRFGEPVRVVATLRSDSRRQDAMVEQRWRDAEVAGSSFFLFDVPAGVYDVAARGASGEAAEAAVTGPADGTARVTLTAAGRATVDGTARTWPERKPLAGARCGWRDESGDRDQTFPLSATSDAAGRFAMGVAAGQPV